jgi:hypothetical protein
VNASARFAVQTAPASVSVENTAGVELRRKVGVFPGSHFLGTDFFHSENPLANPNLKAQISKIFRRTYIRIVKTNGEASEQRRLLVGGRCFAGRYPSFSLVIAV